jgi:hypothetical protein
MKNNILFENTAGPHYSQFLLIRDQKSIQKFRICGFSLAYFRFLTVFDINIALNSHFGAIQYSAIIRGFRIRGVLTIHIYRKLRGPPVFFNHLLQVLPILNQQHLKNKFCLI